MNTTSIQQRKEAILAKAYQNGQVVATRLAEELGISDATVRRDLRALAEAGLLELNHGGAQLRKNLDYSFISKSMRNVEAKRRIAQIAAGLIEGGQQVFLDSGTTCFHIAGYLRGKKNISVIVNSVRTAQELHTPDLHVLMLGGQYRADRMDSVGPITAETLAKIRGYRAFIGCDGAGMDFGPSSIDIDSAHIFSMAIRNARESILLADYSKFESPALFKIANWNSISMVITEKPPPAKWTRFFEQNQIQILYPENPNLNVITETQLNRNE